MKDHIQVDDAQRSHSTWLQYRRGSRRDSSALRLTHTTQTYRHRLGDDMVQIESQMRVLVTGGRDYQNRDLVFDCLNRLAWQHFELTKGSDIVVINGACCVKDKPLELRGADRWSTEWALEHEHPVISVPARWATYGKAAGPERNQRMLDFMPTNAIAFPGGSGTANMIDVLHKAGIIVWMIEQQRPLPRRTIRG